MKTISIFLLFSLFTLSSSSQVPGIKWEKYIQTHNFSGDGVQVIYDAKPTKDKGFILAGIDTGWSAKAAIINKTAAALPMLVKLDSNGKKDWIRYAPASSIDLYSSAYLSVQQTADRGFVAAGYAGGAYPNWDSGKFYIVKYSSNGNLQWEKRYGGTRPNKAYSIQQLSGGFIVAGFTASNNGDVTGNHFAGRSDVWLLRLNNSGDIVWKKCFGGTGFDTAYTVLQTPDKGYLIAGSTTSNDGDVYNNAGAVDAWVLKTDSLGNLQWQNTYGGAGYDAFKSMSLNQDGTYTFTGYSSGASVFGNSNAGKKDLWVVKTNANGGTIWSKLFGGTQDEQGLSIQSTPKGNLLLSGYTESNNGMVNGNSGGADAWLLNLSPAGNLLWQKCVGTINDEISFACMSLTEHDFAVAGVGKPIGAYTDFDGYFVSLGNSNTIKGTIFKDDNLNGLKDAGEIFSAQQIAVNVQKQSGYQRSTITLNGQFSIDVDTGSYITTAQINNPYFNILPATRPATFSSYFNTDSFSFALQPIPNKNDLSISLIPITPARPGFATSYRILYKNVGTTTIPSGEVVLKKDSRITLISSIPAVNSSNVDTLKWNYTNLAPGDTASISVNFKVAPPPTVNNNDTLFFTAFINPVAGDETPADDTAVLKQRVVGSFDPNDKTESNAGVVQPSFITEGSSLQYLIRFQNTGSDTAFNVVVRDTLSSRVDPSTLDMVTASHPYTLSVENGNQLTWTFTNILLPDSNVNEPASHGYIVYRIRPKADVTAGETIHNTASIYFDYNLPVLTNDAQTLVRANLATLPLVLLNFRGNLHENRTTLSWETAAVEDLLWVEIERSTDGRRYQPIGVQRPSGAATDFSFIDDLSTIQNPVVYYRLKMIERNGGYSYSNVLVFKRNVVHLKKLEVFPNPVSGEAFVSFTSKSTGTVEVALLNASGVIVKKGKVPVQKGTNVFAVPGARLMSPGIYTVRIIATDGNPESVLILVQK